MLKLKVVKQRYSDKEDRYYFQCPNCNDLHFFPVWSERNKSPYPTVNSGNWWTMYGGSVDDNGTVKRFNLMDFRPCVKTYKYFPGKDGRITPYTRREKICHVWLKRGRLDYCGGFEGKYCSKCAVPVPDIRLPLLAKAVGIKLKTLHARLYRGWTITKAISTPVKMRRPKNGNDQNEHIAATAAQGEYAGAEGRGQLERGGDAGVLPGAKQPLAVKAVACARRKPAGDPVEGAEARALVDERRREIVGAATE